MHPMCIWKYDGVREASEKVPFGKNDPSKHVDFRA